MYTKGFDKEREGHERRRSTGRATNKQQMEAKTFGKVVSCFDQEDFGRKLVKNATAEPSIDDSIPCESEQYSPREQQSRRVCCH